MAEPRLHVEARGEGPLVVLGHGFGGSARNWRPQVRALEPHYRVVGFDARGHARSEAPAAASAYALACLVSDLGRVLDSEGADRAVVGGLSMGALVALHFALGQAGRVRGLVLSSFPAPGGEGGFAAVAEAFADAIDREGLEAAGERFAWGPGSGLDPQGAALVRQGFLEHDPAALAAILRQVIGAQPPLDTLLAEVGALEVPALLLVGARDRGSRGVSLALADALPGARLAIIEDAGHVANLANPRAFNAELEGFLAGLPV